MTGRRRAPRICIGYGDNPCPTNELMWWKHSIRCRSCGAKQRIINNPSTSITFHSHRDVTTFDSASIIRSLSARNIAVCDAEVSMGWSRGSLDKALSRGRLDYYRLDELACWLGMYVEELVA